MPCALLREVCRGVRKGFGTIGKGSNHGHNRVSTYAEIKITTMNSKIVMMMILHQRLVLQCK